VAEKLTKRTVDRLIAEADSAREGSNQRARPLVVRLWQSSAHPFFAWHMIKITWNHSHVGKDAPIKKPN
jgi:hypothetical protein